MLNCSSLATETLIVGAGPYGLSLAAQLRATGTPFRIFGKAMQTWVTGMPEGMRLHSSRRLSNLCAGSRPFTLADFAGDAKCPATGEEQRLRRSEFIAYGQEFARRLVPDLEDEHVKSIDRRNDCFQITTAGGERFRATRVVIATGMTHQEHMPAELTHLPATRVTHTSQHATYAPFAGRSVIVLGGGASALDAAVLLHEAGAFVTLLAREKRLKLGTALQEADDDGGCRRLFTNPRVYRGLPLPVRRLVRARRPPANGEMAPHGQAGGFDRMLGSVMHAAEPADGGCDRIRLTVSDAQGRAHQLLTSHLIAATGYRFNKDRLGMLSQSLREQIRTNAEGAPWLNGSFESTVPGLFFVGGLAAPTFGPRLQSLAGIPFATARVAEVLRALAQAESVREPRAVRLGLLGRRQRAT